MDLPGWFAVLVGVALLVGGMFSGAMMFSDTKVIEVEKPIVTEKVVEVEKECPICPEVVIPDVEDNLKDDFYKDYFADEYTEIENNAETYALEELEDDDYEVVVDYLKANVEGLDEDSVEVGVDETDVVVTQLGLEEDEDKSATVTFEVEAEYELEEGVRDNFEKDLTVVYDVNFDEGDFDDEEVELVSIA